MDTLRPSLLHNTLTGYAPAPGSNRTSTRSSLHSALRIVRLLDRRTRALLGASRLGFSVVGAATLLAVLVTAAGGHEFRWKENLVLAVVLAVFSVGVFVYALGLPFPLWPESFTG